MRRPGGPSSAAVAAFAVVLGAALAVAAMSAFGLAGFVGWMRANPAEFPTCRGAPPQPGEPVVLSGGCYTSTGFPLDNDTLFCAAPVGGETLRWTGACVDTYAPPALTSLGSPAVLANATALRGIGGTGLASAGATDTHVLLDVPQPSSAGGTSLVADAGANVFLGLEAQGSVQLGAGAGTVVVRDVPWERGEVGAIGIDNVDAFVGETLFYREYTLDNRAHGEARGAIYVQYTDAARLTTLQLDLRIVAPVGSGTGWVGPGAVGCAYKELQPGSVAALLVAAAAFSRGDGMPYLYFMSPADFGSGVTIECTFEMAYMYEL